LKHGSVQKPNETQRCGFRTKTAKKRGTDGWPKKIARHREHPAREEKPKELSPKAAPWGTLLKKGGKKKCV